MSTAREEGTFLDVTFFHFPLPLVAFCFSSLVVSTKKAGERKAL